MVECQKLNTSTKAVYVIQLSDALITQLNIFKYTDDISKKFIPNLVLMRKFHSGAVECYFLLLFVMRENSLFADIIHQELTCTIPGF